MYANVMRPIRRAWRIAFRISLVSIRAQMEYRVEFLLGIAMGAAYQVSLIVFAAVVLYRFPSLGGWSSGDVLLIAAIRLICHGLYVLVFGRIEWLVMLVQEGAIDVFLLRPLPVYRQVQLVSVSPNAFGDLAVASVLFAGALARSGVDWSPAKAAYLAVAVVGGVLTEAAINTVIGCAALHAPATQYWADWVRDIMATVGNYPLHIFPALLSGALTFVLPLAFVAYLPAAALTGHSDSVPVSPWLTIAAPLVGLAAFLLSRWLWTVSLRNYKSPNG
jgi:ABC-2 type transport system permease protein